MAWFQITNNYDPEKWEWYESPNCENTQGSTLNSLREHFDSDLGESEDKKWFVVSNTYQTETAYYTKKELSLLIKELQEICDAMIDVEPNEKPKED